MSGFWVGHVVGLFWERYKWWIRYRKSSVSELNAEFDRLQAAGQHGQAKRIAEIAVSKSRGSRGDSQLSTAVSLLNLASTYGVEGALGKVEPLLKRAVAIQNKLLGRSNLETARTWNWLRQLYQSHKRFEKAEAAATAMVQIAEQVYGEDGEGMTEWLMAQAESYKCQGRYDDAERIQLRALALDELHLGDSHPNTANTRSNLGFLYATQGKFLEAESQFQQTLMAYEAVPGDSLDKAMALYNLATIYLHQRRPQDAKPLLERALAIRLEKLGPVHSLTAVCRNNLATAYEQLGSFQEAVAIYSQALDAYAESANPPLPELATTMNNLGRLYSKMSRFDEAEHLLKECYGIRSKLLGPMHSWTLGTRLALEEVWRKRAQVHGSRS